MDYAKEMLHRCHTHQPEERIPVYANELQEVCERIAELEAECLRFYHADGTYEVLASPEEVVERRVECAKRIETLEAELKTRPMFFAQ